MISEYKSALANAREKLVLDAKALLQGGESKTRVARKVGVSLSTLNELLARYDREGYAGLMPRTGGCGRKSMEEKFRAALGAEKWAEVCKTVKGENHDVESSGLAWRKFARTAEAPQVIRDYFNQARRSKHNIARSLKSVVSVTESQRLAHRGPRALNLRGMYVPRELDILPGDVFSSDDTTPIWAWWVPWPVTPETPFGCKILQGQLLPVMDVGGQHPLVLSLIARETAAYRACDIWALFGRVFDLVGLPRLGFQLERGSWDATLIQGAEMHYQDGDISQSRRVGGLRMLPTRVLDWHIERNEGMREFPKTLQTFTSYLPKSKSVEGLFHRLQKFEGTIYGCLGRDQMREPFERTKKLYEACKRGSEDPRHHFLSAEELMLRLNNCVAAYNDEMIEGQVFHGKPSEVWEAGMRQHGLGAEMPENLKFMFRRDWAKVTIKRGWAYVRKIDPATGRQVGFFYTNPERFAELEGQEVLVYFDRDDCEQPAQIVHPNPNIGHLCEAEYFHRKGMFTDGDMDGFGVRRRWRDAVMTHYSDVVAYIPSRQIPEEVRGRRRAAQMARRWDSGQGTIITIDRPSGAAVVETDTLQPLEHSRGGLPTVGSRPTRAPIDTDALEAEIARREKSMERDLSQYRT